MPRWFQPERPLVARVVRRADDRDGSRADVRGVRRQRDRLSGRLRSAVDGDVVYVRVPNGAAALPGLLRELDRAGVPLASVEVRRPTLDDVFLSLTGRSLHG